MILDNLLWFLAGTALIVVPYVLWRVHTRALERRERAVWQEVYEVLEQLHKREGGQE